MPRRLIIRRLAIAAIASGFAAMAQAGPEMLDVDTKFRARIAKEKLRIAAQEREAQSKGLAAADAGSRCGSQQIGNVDTGGRIGAAPREVFVFAPNAINIVGRGGCR
jgi:hypothetical protein